MTAEEARKIAYEAARPEYEEVVARIKETAERGYFCIECPSLLPATRGLLRNDGYQVKQLRMKKGVWSYDVEFSG